MLYWSDSAGLKTAPSVPSGSWCWTKKWWGQASRWRKCFWCLLFFSDFTLLAENMKDRNQY